MELLECLGNVAPDAQKIESRALLPRRGHAHIVTVQTSDAIPPPVDFHPKALPKSIYYGPRVPSYSPLHFSVKKILIGSIQVSFPLPRPRFILARARSLCHTPAVPRRAKPRLPTRAPSSGNISLKALAEYLGLSPATVSLVINRSPVADSIPQTTKDRILAAASDCNYRPNHIARSLRQQRTFTVGVIVPEVSEGYAALVMSGIEDFLLQAGYFYFVVSHRHKKDLLDEYSRLFLGRSVDGLIAVDTLCEQKLPIPVVSVSGHREVSGVTNVVIHHQRAAFLAVNHLVALGHREIAFIKGQDFSSDTETRWNAILEACRKLKIRVSPDLTGQLVGESSSPEVGYDVTLQILRRRKPFTALFAFNDIAAIGAIAALRQAGFSVPADVSVVGFDDIQSAAYQNPPLTTVRQPLRKMGEMAAKILLRRIGASPENPYEKLFVLEPELVIRSSSGPCPVRA